MKRSVFVIPLAVALAACSSAPKLTKEGAAIKNVSQYTVDQCRQLSVAEGYGSYENGKLKAAEIDVRNKVAAAGGNAMHVVQKYTVPKKGEGAILAYVLRCKPAVR